MKKLFLISIIFLLILLTTPIIYGEECEEEKSIYLFYSKTCPHCKNEINFLQQLQKKYPEIKVTYYEVSVNFNEYQTFADKHNTSTAGVPRTFIGNSVFIGFSKEDGDLEYSESYKAYIGYENQIRSSILNHFGVKPADNGKINGKMSGLWFWLLLLLYLLSYLFIKNKIKEKPELIRYWLSGLIALSIVLLFLTIKLTPETAIKEFASKLPFPLFVFIIAIADGFNPCAFTVLIILLSLLTYTKDKKSMLILGMTFIITSAVMYFIFIMAMIFIGTWAIQQHGPIFITILGVVILFAGIINIKDFFFFKQGISLSISDENKSNFTHKAHRIVKAIVESKTLKTFIFALLGTALLAAFVNLVELGCTAILPAVYMVSLLTIYKGNLLMQVFWTIFYSVIYILPLLAILLNFIYTFKSTRLTEKQGRILKLVSGLFMVIFGLIMLFKPELLMFS